MRAPLLALIAMAAAAQSFDSASITPNRSAGRRGDFRIEGNRLAISNFTLRSLIQWAYGVRDFQISGGPSWVDTDRFDVTAAAGVNVEPGQMKQLLRGLLAERFQLAVHRETRIAHAYALTVEKSGNKLHEAGPSSDPEGIRLHPTPAGMELAGHHADVARLAAVLTEILRRQVVDQTGIQGSFDFKLAWTPDSGSFYLTPSGPGDPLIIDSPAGAATDLRIQDAGPTIFAALSKQLGLKLESRKAPVEILSIDRVQKLPAENLR